MSVVRNNIKITTNTLLKMKQEGEKIVCITAYDYTSAKILDSAGVEMLLVGDSLGMVISGHETTLPVTIEDIIYHTKSVKRAAKNSFVIADIPFGYTNISDEDTIRNCMRVMKETGANAIKIEGGAHVAPVVERLTTAGIAVMAHIGLMPQSVNAIGGYKVFGADSAEMLVNDAIALEKAGAFAITLECVRAEVAKQITEAVSVPTIGIGAGVHCDGQVLVFHDVFGMFTDFKPKFVKRYANVAEVITNATNEFMADVKSGKYPDDEHTFK